MNKWTTVQRETLLRAKSTFSRAVPVDNTSEIDFRHNLNFWLNITSSMQLFLPISPYVFPKLVMLTVCVWEKCSYSWGHQQCWVTFSKACTIEVICRLYRGQYHDPQGEATRVKAIQELGLLTKLLRLLIYKEVWSL